MTDQPFNRRPQRRSGNALHVGTGLQNLDARGKSQDARDGGGSGAGSLTRGTPSGASPPSGAPAPSGLEVCRGISGICGRGGAFRGRKGGRGASSERHLQLQRQSAQRLHISLGLSQVGCWLPAVSVEISQSILFRVLRARARHVWNCRAHPPFLTPPHPPTNTLAPAPYMPLCLQFRIRGLPGDADHDAGSSERQKQRTGWPRDLGWSTARVRGVAVR